MRCGVARPSKSTMSSRTSGVAVAVKAAIGGRPAWPSLRLQVSAAETCRRSDGQAGRPPIAAFTATATPEVRDDIVDLLGLATPHLIVAGFDRPNIYPSVRPVADESEKQHLLPQLVRNRRALVYT